MSLVTYFSINSPIVIGWPVRGKGVMLWWDFWSFEL